MPFIKWAAVAALALSVGSDAFSGAFAQTQAQATAPASKATIAWAAKPAKLPPYTGHNKLIYRLGGCTGRAQRQAELVADCFRQPRLHRRMDFHGAWRKDQDAILCR